MSATTPIARVKFRLARCAVDWAEVVEIVNEAAAAAGDAYAGPSPQSVQRISDDMAATREAVAHWYAAVVASGKRGRSRRPERATWYSLSESAVVEAAISVPEMTVDPPEDGYG